MVLVLLPIAMIIEIIQVWQAAPVSLWAWVQSAFGITITLNFFFRADPHKPPTQDFRKSQMQLYFAIGLLDLVVAGSHFLFNAFWKDVPVQSIWVTIAIGIVITLLAGLGLLLLRKKTPGKQSGEKKEAISTMSEAELKEKLRQSVAKITMSYTMIDVIFSMILLLFEPTRAGGFTLVPAAIGLLGILTYKRTPLSYMGQILPQLVVGGVVASLGLIYLEKGLVPIGLIIVGIGHFCVVLRSYWQMIK